MFVLVIRVLIRHSRNTLGRSKELVNKKTTIRLLISITGVMSLFGLTWLFGALTVTGFGDSGASTAFQVFFVFLNAFQGFFIFLFFCVFSKDARELWMEVLTCGRYKSTSLHPSQTKYARASASSATLKKVKTANANLASSNLSSSVLPSSSDAFTDNLSEEKIPLTSAAEEGKKEKPFPEVHETDIDEDQKADLGLLEKSEGKDQALERTGSADHQSKKQDSPSPSREDGVELKKEKLFPEVQETDIDKDQKADLGPLETSEGKGKDEALEGTNSADSKKQGSPSQSREDGVELINGMSEVLLNKEC